MRGAASDPTPAGHASRGRRSQRGPWVQPTVPPDRRPRDRALRRMVAALLTMPLVSMQLLAAPVEAGERYALVVGVENYIPDELPSLEYAEDDATALSAALADLGFSVITMTAQAKNPLQRPTSAAQILDQVTDRLRERAASDTVVLAFSGHGVQFRGEKETYFCPEQATLSKRDSLVPMSTVMALIGRSAAKRKLLLVDACRDELEPPIAAKGGIVVQLEAAGVFRPEPAKGTVVLFSCAEQEKSYESRALGHSVFSHYVIEYLAGKAPADRYPGGEVGVIDMATYVSSRTRETVSTAFSMRQTPAWVVPEQPFSEWPLGTLAGDRPRRGENPPGSGGPEDVIVNAIGMRLVPVAATDQPPVRRFFIGQTEVTQAEWFRVMDRRPAYFSPQGDGSGRIAAAALEADFLPVESISWFEATDFCARLTEIDRSNGTLPEGHAYRPPTAAEWLAAWQAGRRTGPEGETRPSAWCAANSDRHPHAVAALAPSRLGIHDLLGNVGEWCQDRQPSDDDGRPLRMVRGGSWFDDAADCTAERVFWMDEDGQRNTCGLRVVLSPVGGTALAP